jgi:hypothetical protein
MFDVYVFLPPLPPNGIQPCLGQVLAVGGGGLIYGTTYLGGTSNDGTVFTLHP